MFLIEHLHAVGAEVYFAGFRVADDNKDCGADIATAIQRIKPGRREFFQVNVIAFNYVFQHRTAGDFLRRDDLIQDSFHPALGQIAHRIVGRHSQDHGQTFGGPKRAGQHRRVVAFNVLKQQRRAVAFFNQFGNVGYFQVPVHFGGNSL